LRHNTGSKRVAAASDLPADRHMFEIDDRRWKEFMAALDAPPKDNP
jgi:uncharacterized protein (DUF1778 family)